MHLFRRTQNAAVFLVTLALLAFLPSVSATYLELECGGIINECRYTYTIDNSQAICVSNNPGGPYAFAHDNMDRYKLDGYYAIFYAGEYYTHGQAWYATGAGGWYNFAFGVNALDSFCVGNPDANNPAGQRICADLGRVWGGNQCCDSGDSYLYNNGNSICYKGAVAACSVMGQTMGSPVAFACDVNMKWTAFTTPCTIGGSIGNGVAPPADGSKPCCVGTAFDSTLAPDGKCYLSAAVENADYFAHSCAYQLIHDPDPDPLASANDIFAGPDGLSVVNRCAGNNALQNPYFTGGVNHWNGATLSAITPPSYFNASNTVAQVTKTASSTTTTEANSDAFIIRDESTTRNVTFSGVVYLDTSQTNDAPVVKATGGASIVLWWSKNSAFSGTAGTDYGSFTASTSTKDKIVYLQSSVQIPTGAKYLRVNLVNAHAVSNQVVYFAKLNVQGKGVDYGATNADGTRIILQTADKTSYMWFDATAGQNVFKIQQTPLFSAISNGNAWFLCNPGSVSGIPNANTFSAVSLPQYQASTAGGSTATPVVTPTSPSPSPSGGNTAGIITGNGYDQDTFLTGFVSAQSTQQTNVQSTQAGSGTMIFSVTPSQVSYSDIVHLTITGLTGSLSDFDINTSYPILVNTSAGFVPVSHGFAAPDGAGTIADLPLTLPANIEKGDHTLNITFVSCASGACNIVKGRYLFNASFTVVQNPVINSNNPLNINPGKFLCSAQGGLRPQSGQATIGSIIECCGPDMNYCINGKNQDTTRISGGPTSLLKDYFGSSSNKNGVALVGCTPASPGSECRWYVPNPRTSFQITDWSSYDYLEFDVFFANTNALNVLISGNVQDSSKDILADTPIAQYSTTGNALHAWHHIKIPLSPALKSDSPKIMKIYVQQTEFDSLSLTGDVPFKQTGGTTIHYAAVFGLDRIFLSSSSTQYCAQDASSFGASGSAIGKWISDLDQDKQACNNVASYHWTGSADTYSDGKQTHCCGNNQYIPVAPPTSNQQTAIDLATLGSYPKLVLFNQSTSGNITVPSGVSYFIVEMWGAGGGGSGAVATKPSGNYRWQSAGGGGGGSGAYIKTIVPVTAGEIYSISVGTGGSGSGAIYEDSNSGDSSFACTSSGNKGGDSLIVGPQIPANYLIAHGGLGGTGACAKRSRGNYDGAGGSGGSGGIATSNLSSLVAVNGAGGGVGTFAVDNSASGGAGAYAVNISNYAKGANGGSAFPGANAGFTGFSGLVVVTGVITSATQSGSASQCQDTNGVANYSSVRGVDSGTNGGNLMCNSDEVVCGAQNLATSGSVLDHIYCCKLPAGITVNTSAPRGVDSGTNGGTLTCNQGEVMCGAQNLATSNSALDHIYCCPITAQNSSSLTVSYPQSQFVDSGTGGGDLMCGSNEVACGAQNVYNANDKLDHLGCCSTTLRTCVPSSLAGTANSPNALGAVDETYYDEQGACWSGQPVLNDTIVPVSVTP